VIRTWLVERSRTHDRYYSVAYETTNQDGEAEPLAFYLGQTDAIARNNLSHARETLDQQSIDPHLVIRRDRSTGERETFEFPNEYMAEKAADVQHDVNLRDDDRDYQINVRSKAEWREYVELQQQVAAHDDGETE
jgi:hypothetical protein